MLWCYISINKVIRLTHFKRESICNNLRWNTHNGKDLNKKISYMYRNHGDCGYQFCSISMVKYHLLILEPHFLYTVQQT